MNPENKIINRLFPDNQVINECSLENLEKEYWYIKLWSGKIDRIDSDYDYHSFEDYYEELKNIW